MPRFDGTGPQGRGPMTGNGLGHCVLRESMEEPGRMEGWVGIDGVPVGGMNPERAEQEKEVVNMPLGDRTGPVGMGPMTGRAAGFCAGYPVPGYRNPGGFGAGRAVPYGAPWYGHGAGYVAPRTGWFGRLIRRGFGLGRGLGRGRGRSWHGRWGGFGYEY
jgi:hypothetical protein